MKTSESRDLSHSLNSIAWASIMVFFAIFISKLLNYIYKIIIARHFGPEIFGLFSLATMIIGWFIAVASFGLSDGLLRFISFFRTGNQNKKISFLFNRTLGILVVSGLAAGIILFLAAPFIANTFFHDVRLISFIRILSAVVPLSIILGPFLSALLAYERAGWHSFIVNILQTAVIVLSLSTLIMFGLDTHAITLSYLLGTLVMTICAYIACRIKLPVLFKSNHLPQKARKSLFNTLFSYSWPRLFLGVIASLFFWIDSFILGYFKGAFEVGLYNVAIPIALLMGFAPDLFMKLFFPLVNRKYSVGNIPLIRDLSKQIGKWIFLINVPLLLVILIFPSAIINVLFGEQYLAAANTLRILAVGSFIYSITLVSMNLISMAGKSRTVLTNFIVVTCLNIVLNLLLVPKYGLTGAALAVSLSYAVLGIMFFIQTKRHLNITPFKADMIKIAAISLIPALLLIGLSNLLQVKTLLVLLTSVILFGIVYAILIFASRSLDTHDKEVLDSLWKRVSAGLIWIKTISTPSRSD